MIQSSDMVPDVEEAVKKAVKDKLLEVYEEQTGETAAETLDRLLKEQGFVVDEEARLDAKSRDGDEKVRYVLGPQIEREMTVEELARAVGIDVGELPLNGKATIEVQGIVVELDPKKGTVEVNAVKLELEGALHTIELASWDVRWGALGAKVSAEPYTFVPTGPYAARVGDPMSHGSVAGPGPGSANVFIGGRPALRAGDTHACPAATPLPHGASAFLSTQSKVLINGRPALRQGDCVMEPMAGPNVIVGGCPRVLVGEPAPAVDTHGVVVGEQRYLFRSKGAVRLDFGFFRLKTQGGLGTSESGKVRGNASFEFDVAAARLTAEQETEGQALLDFIDLDVPGIGRVHPDAAKATSKAEMETLFGTCGGKVSARKGENGKRWKAAGGRGSPCGWVRPGEMEIDADTKIEMNETPGDER